MSCNVELASFMDSSLPFQTSGSAAAWPSMLHQSPVNFNSTSCVITSTSVAQCEVTPQLGTLLAAPSSRSSPHVDLSGPAAASIDSYSIKAGIIPANVAMAACSGRMLGGGSADLLTGHTPVSGASFQYSFSGNRFCSSPADRLTCQATAVKTENTHENSDQSKMVALNSQDSMSCAQADRKADMKAGSESSSSITGFVGTEGTAGVKGSPSNDKKTESQENPIQEPQNEVQTQSKDGGDSSIFLPHNPNPLHAPPSWSMPSVNPMSAQMQSWRRTLKRDASQDNAQSSRVLMTLRGGAYTAPDAETGEPVEKRVHLDSAPTWCAELEKKRLRFLRTRQALEKSGLMGVTLKTAQLMQSNSALDNEIMLLKRETAQLLQLLLGAHGNQQEAKPAHQQHSPKQVLSYNTLTKFS